MNCKKGAYHYTVVLQIYAMKGSTYLTPPPSLTLNPLTWRIWWGPNNASKWQMGFNPLNAEINPICNLLALLEAHHILHFSGLRVNSAFKGLNTNLSHVVSLYRPNCSVLFFFFFCGASAQAACEIAPKYVEYGIFMWFISYWSSSLRQKAVFREICGESIR